MLLALRTRTKFCYNAVTSSVFKCSVSGIEKCIEKLCLEELPLYNNIQLFQSFELWKSFNYK